MRKLTNLLITLALGAGLAGTAQAQAQFSPFSEHGRYFYVAPTVWGASANAQRQAIGARQAGGTWRYASEQFLGAAVGGQYFFHGIMLGYQLGVGVTPKADYTPAGSQFLNRQRDYTSDIQGQVGLIAFRAGGLTVMPVYGIGGGAWYSQFKQVAIPDASGRIETEDRESGVTSGHIIQDLGLQTTFMLPSPDGESRFSLSLKTGYKTYTNASKGFGEGNLQFSGAGIGTKGFYAQLGLGVGILTHKAKHR